MTVPTKVKASADSVAHRILANKADYVSCEKDTGVPWHWIAIVHYRESDLDFKTHLANGDPLTGRTVHVPKGLIAGKNPPYTWPEAAAAALEHENEPKTGWDDFGRYCYQLEAYNGWGYREKGVTSPYLWSQSNQHTRGKYVSDGVYSATAIDEQLGALVVLKSLMAVSPDITFSNVGTQPVAAVKPVPSTVHVAKVVKPVVAASKAVAAKAVSASRAVVRTAAVSVASTSAVSVSVWSWLRSLV